MPTAAPSLAQTTTTGRLTLDRVEVRHLGIEVQTAGVHLPVLGGNQRHALMCRIHTREGPVGEAYVGLLGANGPEVAGWMGRELLPLLAGRDLSMTEDCWDAMFTSTHRAYFSRPLAMRAIALMDCALWDLKGQALGLPLTRVWGGGRTSLDVLVLCGSIDPALPVDASARRIEALVRDGHAGLKLKVGSQSGLSPRDDARRVGEVRAMVGGEVLLVADANQGWTLAQALEFAGAVQEADLLWLEEPCHWDNDAVLLARLRTQTRHRLCAGQMEHTESACLRLMQQGAIDVCNFDAAIGGGATPWRRVATAARLLGVEMVHHIEPQLGLMLGAWASTARFAEVCEPLVDPFFGQLIANRPRIAQGRIDVPEEPGWGWHYDRGAIGHATLQQWSW